MKKPLIILSFLLLTVLLVSAFTFYPSVEARPSGEKWFQYLLNNNSGINDPANYSLSGDGSQAPVGCVGGLIRCAVKAQPSSNPNRPNLATVIETREKP